MRPSTSSPQDYPQATRVVTPTTWPLSLRTAPSVGPVPGAKTSLRPEPRSASSTIPETMKTTSFCGAGSPSTAPQTGAGRTGTGRPDTELATRGRAATRATPTLGRLTTSPFGRWRQIAWGGEVLEVHVHCSVLMKRLTTKLFVSRHLHILVPPSDLAPDFLLQAFGEACI